MEELSGNMEEEGDSLAIPEQVWLERAENELHETNDVRTKALAELRQLIETDYHLNRSKLPDRLLLMSLRTTKFSVGQAFARLRNWSQLRKNALAKLSFHKINVDYIMHVLSQYSVSSSARFDHMGRKIFVVQPGRSDPDKAYFTDLVLSGTIAMICIALDYRVQIGGFVVVCDLKGISWKHAKQFTPAFIKLCAAMVKECHPIRLKQLHICHMPFSFVRMISTILAGILGKTIRERLRIYGDDFTALHEEISLEMLPKELGGSCPGTTESPYLKDTLQYAESIGLMEVLREMQRADSH